VISLRLREYPLKRSYTSGLDNPLEDFLIPILNIANRFFYISGFFSSKLIALLSYGIKNFIVKNGGKIKLIAGFVFPSDIKILNLPKDELQKQFIEIVNEDFFSKELEKKPEDIEHLKLFAWLLNNKKIEIKWGLIFDPLIENFNNSGILHEKVGILQDVNSDDKDYITFSGSANATYYAWVKNREEMKIFKSWEENGREYAEYDFNKFKNYWNGKDSILKIFNFPIEFIRDLIDKYLPKENNLNEIDFELIDNNVRNELQKEIWWKLKKEQLKEKNWKYVEYSSKKVIETIIPRDYQEDALSLLERNDYTGFLEMATGSGKTKIAIMASYNLYKKLIEEKKRLLIIISVPDSYLVDQWYNEVFMYTNNVVKCYSQNSNWRELLKNQISRLIYKSTDHCYVIATHESFNSESWENYIIRPCKNIKKYLKILFIGDEAHTLGAPTRRLTIENITTFLESNYKIGLSATPIREYDEEGTQFILNFFTIDGSDKRIYSFPLKNAQERGFLMKFNYYPIRCDFDTEKFDEFRELTEKIGKKINVLKKINAGKKEITQDLTILLNKRADLLKKADSKLNPLKRLINDLNLKHQLWKTVIYTKDKEQRSKVNNVITEVNELFELRNKISKDKIDGSDLNPIRIERINNLTNNVVNLLIVMKCLDQGVDIPSLERAIFLSSSGTQLEHIQRAGRLLRRNENKKEPVEIYDFFVFPTKAQIEEDKNISKKIYSIEKRRIEFFAEVAENKSDLEDLIWELNTELF